MPSLVDKEFQDFIVNIGLRKDVAETLWNADIRSPQELAACEEKDLLMLTSNPLLVKNICPLLQKYLYNISMAKNPYKKAIAILKKHAEKMDDDADDEPMEVQSALLADSTVGDSTAFVGGESENVPGGGESCSTRRQTEMDASNSVRYNNSAMTMTTSGTNTGGNRIQSHIMLGNSKVKPGNQPSINISGGNFVQSNILSQGPVTYNNTNSTINTSLDQSFILDAKKRRAERLNSSMVINGRVVKIADISWNDNSDFWVNRVTIPECEYDFYSRHLSQDEIYSVRNVGGSRALILNNINFKPGSRMDKRKGADVDGKNMQELLEKLGFKVRMEVDHTAAEMKEIVREFTQSRDNMRSDMVAVYIGSHGERDGEGNDTFVGTDGVRVKLNDVKKYFSPDVCPSFINKPKIFFLQFCRMEKRKSTSTSIEEATPVLQTASVHSDANTGNVPDRNPVHRRTPESRVMDLLSVYATLAGTKAYRDTADGSWFVTAMVRIISEHGDKDDLLSMLTKVNNSVSINEGMERNHIAVQVSEVVHTLRKKVYFFPGQK